MFDKALGIVAPHICCGCGNVGSVLCEHCMNDIISHPFTDCTSCLTPIAVGNLCIACKSQSACDGVWCIGYRKDTIHDLIDLYKFERVMAADVVCARLFDQVLSNFPSDTVITYVPTISRHVRQRGYDHMKRIAQRLGDIRGLRVERLIERPIEVVQRGATRRDRLSQQRNAFTVTATINHPVLIIDDIYTTGATLEAVSVAVRNKSSHPLYAAVLARQPLEVTTDL